MVIFGLRSLDTTPLAQSFNPIDLTERVNAANEPPASRPDYRETRSSRLPRLAVADLPNGLGIRPGGDSVGFGEGVGTN